MENNQIYFYTKKYHTKLLSIQKLFLLRVITPVEAIKDYENTLIDMGEVINSVTIEGTNSNYHKNDFLISQDETISDFNIKIENLISLLKIEMDNLEKTEAIIIKK